MKKYFVSLIDQLFKRFNTGWTVRGSNPVGEENFYIRPERSGFQPASCATGTVLLPGGKVAEVWR
jgi:hypothetical protein